MQIHSMQELFSLSEEINELQREAKSVPGIDNLYYILFAVIRYQMGIIYGVINLILKIMPYEKILLKEDQKKFENY